jgi:hypothetical protein
MKDNGARKEDIAYMAGLIGLATIVSWSVYHVNGNGAANSKLLSKTEFKEETSPLNDSKSATNFELDVQL